MKNFLVIGLVTSFVFFMSYQAHATDLYVEKDKKGNVLTAFSMTKQMIGKELSLDKLSTTSPLSSLDLLNNYYVWGYKNEAKQALSLYAKTDNSWQRLNDKLNKGKSPFKNFSKLTGVKVKEKLLWGDYQLFKVTWDVQGKSYNWTDTVYCQNGQCAYSDILFRFSPLENALSAVLAQSVDKLIVDKKGLEAFDIYPKGASKEPLTFYYNFNKNSVPVWPLSLKENKASNETKVGTYLSLLHATDFTEPAKHKEQTAQIVGEYWQGTTEDAYLKNYTYQGNALKVQDYSLAAYNNKLLSYEKVKELGSISSSDGRFVLCQGENVSGMSELFFVPISNTGKLYIPGRDNITWMFVNTEGFANHLNLELNKKS